MPRIGASIHALAVVGAAAVVPTHGEHVRDTLAKALGITVAPTMALPAPLGTVKHGAVVLCPKAGAAHKEWPAERWQALADALVARNRQVVWAPEVTSLAWLERILAGASLVIAVDSGPIHLADALGTPVLGLYAATSSLTYGPYGQRDRCIDKHHEASEAMGFDPYDSSRHLIGSQAMEHITVDDVLEAIDG